MNIRIAEAADIEKLLEHDGHISRCELKNIISLGRVLIAEENGIFMGWLRWNLFWDNTPFMNMLFLLEGYRRRGYGSAMVSYWEKLMHENGYKLILTSSQSNEEAQHFYRKLGYKDSGSLLLTGEPLEIIFAKEI